MIYIDNPVGTGFSFTDKDEGYARNQIDVGENLYSALYQFFTLFPELQQNDFYATGESYAGKYVSIIMSHCHGQYIFAIIQMTFKKIFQSDALQSDVKKVL